MSPASRSTSGGARPRTRRQARSGWDPIDLPLLWRYRELLVFYAIRDIKVRYKQTALGALWAVLQPLTMMLVFSIFFGNLAGVPSDGKAYPIYAFCALLPWQLFSYAVTQSSNCLIQDAQVLRRVDFPRLVLPFASVIAGLVDFAIAFAILVVLMVVYGVTPSWSLAALPVLVLLTVLASLAVGLWLSALNVRYRDVRYAIPFLVQLWLFATPVAYSSSLIPEAWRTVYGLNPMVGVVDGFRWALVDGPVPSLGVMTMSVVVTTVLFVGGLFYFRRMERTFADIV